MPPSLPSGGSCQSRALQLSLGTDAGREVGASSPWSLGTSQGLKDTSCPGLCCESVMRTSFWQPSSKTVCGLTSRRTPLPPELEKPLRGQKLVVEVAAEQVKGKWIHGPSHE